MKETDTIKLPVSIVIVLLGALVSLQAWEVKEVIQLKVEVAAISARLNAAGIAAAKMEINPVALK